MTIAILTPAQVLAGLPTLRKSAEDLTANIHQYAVSTLDHVREHGDIRGVTSLLNALPRSQRVQGLAAWFRHFSTNKLTLKLTGTAWTCELRKDRTDEDFKVAESMETTYADLTKEPEQKAITMAKFIGQIEKVANDTTTLKNGARKVPVEVAELAAEMVRTIRAKAA
jgi:hypothetical protein